MIEFLLNNHISIILGIVILYNIVTFKKEYFPSKPRYYEELLNVYLEYQNYLRYETNTRKHLPNNKLNKFRF